MKKANPFDVYVSPTLEAALEHARAGFKVFPVYHIKPDGGCSCSKGLECKSKGKHPRIYQPAGLATTDEKQLREWWRRWEHSNIGFPCGIDWWCLDIDPRHGGDHTLDLLVEEHGPLPHTVESLTGGGGRHLLFQMPDFPVRNIQNQPIRLGEGLDVRGTGGIIVAPGSMHSSGRRYAWEESSRPGVVPIAAAPDWLLALLQKAMGATKDGKKEPAAPTNGSIPHGVQHDTLVSLAGSMRQRGMEYEEINAALQVANANRCEQPGSVEDIEKIASSICNYPAGEGPHIDWKKRVPPPETAGGTVFVVDPEEPPSTNGAGGAGGHREEAAEEPQAEVGDCQPLDEPAGEPAGDDEEERPPPPDDPPSEVNDRRMHLNDAGNAKRLVKRHGSNIRYCHTVGNWFLWDGQRFRLDDTLGIIEQAKEVALSIYSEASKVRVKATTEAPAGDTEAAEAAAAAAVEAAEDAKAVRKSVVKWATLSENQGRLGAMVGLARSDPKVAIRHEQMDADPWLFNCANGTVNLKTGKLRKASQDDLITKMSPIRFLPGAECPEFLAFLLQIMSGDQDMVDYLQRVVGSILTGVPPDRVMWLLYGLGANGKTTLVNVLHDLMGDYALRVGADTLLAKRNGDGIPNDLAALRGARLVSSAELPEGRQLNEARIKDLTGNEPISARFLNREFFEFRPVFKLLMFGNHKPTVRGQDQGMWDRLKLLPFLVRFADAEPDDGAAEEPARDAAADPFEADPFDESTDDLKDLFGDDGEMKAEPDPVKDPELPGRLKAELDGILAWAVQGCLEWQRVGYQHPGTVRAATAAYRAEQDVLGGFIEECCVVGDGFSADNTLLFAAYQKWSEGEEEPLGRKGFTQKLEARGFKQTRDKGRVWRGIGLQERKQSEQGSGFSVG